MRRGEAYFAIIPYLPLAPLRVFTEDINEEGKKTGTGRIIPSGLEAFKGEENPAVEVLVPFKARMNIIMAPPGELYGVPAALVIPVKSIKPELLKTSSYKRKLVEGVQFKETLLLPPREGLPDLSYLSIPDIKYVHGTLFTGSAGWGLTGDEMQAVEIRLSECLAGSHTLACQTCDRQCEKCEILIAVNQLQ